VQGACRCPTTALARRCRLTRAASRPEYPSGPADGRRATPRVCAKTRSAGCAALNRGRRLQGVHPPLARPGRMGDYGRCGGTPTLISDASATRMHSCKTSAALQARSRRAACHAPSEECAITCAMPSLPRRRGLPRYAAPGRRSHVSRGSLQAAYAISATLSMDSVDKTNNVCGISRIACFWAVLTARRGVAPSPGGNWHGRA
jgi:hypothetical protein